MKIDKQIQLIPKENRCVWLGFWSNSDKIQSNIKEVMEIAKRDYSLGIKHYWVFDLEGWCVAAQNTLELAMRYYNYHPDKRILVHYEQEML